MFFFLYFEMPTRSQSLKSKSYGKSWSSIGGESIFDEPAVDIPGVFHFSIHFTVIAKILEVAKYFGDLQQLQGSSRDVR